MTDSRKYQSQEKDPKVCISKFHALPFTNHKYKTFGLPS